MKSRAQEIRDEKQCSLQEAVAIARRERLEDQIAKATTVEDLKPILLDIIKHGG